MASYSVSQERGRTTHRQISSASYITVPSPIPGSPASLNTPADGEGLSPTETTHLEAHASSDRLYGTLPLPRRRLLNRTSWSNARGSFSKLPLLNTFRRATLGDVREATPHSARSRVSDLSFARYSMRPKTMYDEPLLSAEGDVTDSDARVNGIRVWYTSYTSIDWLHDAIKDSLRFSRLRRRKSLRSRARLMFDKSLGWIIVTIVGFLSAVVAFLVIRSEQFLFDLKEGYCTTSCWKAKRFCCPYLVPSDLMNPHLGQPCAAWRQWHQVGDNVNNPVEYISYTIIAVSLHLSI
jgi:chloride channel 3/4/5